VTGRTRIKICCIAGVDEAHTAIAAGADAVGLVSAMPSGPGPIADELFRDIRRHVPPPIATFLLTCRQDVPSIVEQLRFTGCNTVQLCDEVTRGSYDELRSAIPNVSIVQVIHVTGEESIVDATSAARKGADAILLDSGRPTAAVKELGGTGRVHDWAISRRIRAALDELGVPMFLAGGLSAANVARAVAEVRPFGVDVCSGVRTNGRLDPQKLAPFIAAVRSG
jgi:phosphoribosylanthranilate isomerase